MFWLTAAEELLLKTTQTLCKLICHPLTKRLNLIKLLVSMRISSLLHFNVSGVTLRSNDVSECHEQWNHVTIHTVIKFMMHATFTVESTLMMCCVLPEPDNIYTTATYVIHCLVWFQLLVWVNCFWAYFTDFLIDNCFQTCLYFKFYISTCEWKNERIYRCWTFLFIVLN